MTCAIVVPRLARPNQLHVMAAEPQAFDKTVDRQRNAVDFGRVGLRDDGEAKTATTRLYFVH
ncbi:MAG: hypothetical protein ACK5UX_09245 [Burkholderiales bacterium]